jgi:hypothetical protein
MGDGYLGELTDDMAAKIIESSPEAVVTNWDLFEAKQVGLETTDFSFKTASITITRYDDFCKKYHNSNCAAVIEFLKERKEYNDSETRRLNPGMKFEE